MSVLQNPNPAGDPASDPTPFAPSLRPSGPRSARLATDRPAPGAAGIVYLVGAGPGDPDLITVKGLRCLQRADVVVHDRLVHPDLVAEAPPEAERLYVGKRCGHHAVTQERIQELLVEHARAGKTVVRLKGGDPFVFGRGGEEAAACAAAGVRWEVVPGVTSAVSVPAAAGIPITHRGVAASFAVVTAHRARGEDAPSWNALAGVDTLVVLMGVARLPALAEELCKAGRDPATPAAVVEKGTLPDSRVVSGTLGDIAAKAREAKIASPATIVVGPVAALREELLAAQAASPKDLPRALAELAA